MRFPGGSPQEREFALLSGEFFNCLLPSGYEFLDLYFPKEIHRAFIRYVMIFGSSENFDDHYGAKLNARDKFLQSKMLYRYLYIYEKARMDFDLDLVETIVKGKLVLDVEYLGEYEKGFNYAEFDMRKYIKNPRYLFETNT